MGLDAVSELVVPAESLAVDLGEVADEEGVLAMGVALVEVDVVERNAEGVDD